MRRIISATVIVAVLAACSQSEVEVLAPKFAPSAISLGLNASLPVRISEFHYDNVGGDNNEWIEVSGPGGTNLSGYSLVLYDGASGMAYNTKPLGGTIPTICSGRGVALFMYPLNFIQNGSPDGIALVGPGPSVIEFLSYEGSFTATDGPAAGMTSTDIGVFEDGNGSNSPVTSLWRFGATSVWAGPSQNSFGTCNDHIEPPPADSIVVTPASATLLVSATQQFSAAAFDATQKPIPNQSFFWTSSASSVATVTPLGLVIAAGPGDAMIIASAPNGKADTAHVHVISPNSAPTAVLNGPYSGPEGPTSISMSGAGSTDPDAGDVLTYDWTFGDGSTGTGVNVSHAYPQDGVYAVKLTVTDSHGLTSTVSATATITNVAPSIGSLAGATLLPGEMYSANGSFTDPGADTWSGTVDYGDGSGVVPLSLSGKTFTLNHVWGNPGSYAVTVRVSDDDDTSILTRTVTVLTQGEGVNDALVALAQLVAQGRIETPYSNPIREALQNAASKITGGKMDLAASELDYALRNLDNAVRVGKVNADDVTLLRELIVRIQVSVAPPEWFTTKKNRK